MLTSDGCIYGTLRYIALAMCSHLAGDTHPPFLLVQSLSSKVSVGSGYLTATLSGTLTMPTHHGLSWSANDNPLDPYISRRFGSIIYALAS